MFAFSRRAAALTKGKVMHTIARLIFAVGLALAPILSAAPSEAAFLHTWVATAAAGGSDSNNCDITAPCATFQNAYNNTTAGGEINCLNPGEYGGVTNISASITIDCESAISSVNSGGNGQSGFVITTAASATVILKGLDFDGYGNCNGGGCNGDLIQFNGAGTLHLQKMKVNHLLGNSFGVNFQPTGAATLDVSDSDITDNGNNGNPYPAAGIYIRPASGVQANVTITRTQVQGNYFGIIADCTGGGGIRGVVKDSVVSGSTENGITAMSSVLGVWLLVDETAVTGNSYGMVASGPYAEILARNTSVFNNSTGLYTKNSGTLYSYGNNSVNANTTNGGFTGTVGLQ
jgi:hypothetical protein